MSIQSGDSGSDCSEDTRGYTVRESNSSMASESGVRREGRKVCMIRCA